MAYRALAEALARWLDVMWEIGCGGTAYKDMVGWLNQLGYYIMFYGIDCLEQEALKRRERRFSDPADLLHFGSDPSWYPPAQPDQKDLEGIKLL